MKIVELFWKVESNFSPRIVQESQKWLQEQSSSFGTLSLEQQNSVHRYIERQKKFKRNIGLYLFNFIGALVIIYLIAGFLDQKKAEILQISQSTTYEEPLKVGLNEANDAASLYGVIGMILGIYTGIAMYLVFSLGTTLWDLTILRKTIQAFFPATKRLQ